MTSPESHASLTPVGQGEQIMLGNKDVVNETDVPPLYAQANISSPDSTSSTQNPAPAGRHQTSAQAGSPQDSSVLRHNAGTQKTAADNLQQQQSAPADNQLKPTLGPLRTRPASSSKQLIYLRLKALSIGAAYKFAETYKLASALLPELAKIPELLQTQLFQPGKLTFSMHLHSNQGARGFFFTAAFEIHNLSENVPNIPEMLVKASEITCSLPVIIPAVGASSAKTRCFFALNKDLLYGLTSIDFQVKVPPITSLNPAEDFALLLV